MKNFFTVFFALYFSTLSAQWERLNPPGVLGGVQFAQNDNKLFALSYGGSRLSSSVSNGLTWGLENYPNPANFTYPIAMAADPNIVVILMQDQFGNISWFTSNNGGGNWVPITAAPGFSGNVIVYNGMIYYNEFGAFYRYNSGTWDPLLNAPSNSYEYTVAFSGNKIWVTTNNGLQYSLDDGTSWTGIGPLGAVSSVAVVGTTLAVVSGNDVRYSMDNGTSWPNSNLSGPNFRVFADEGKFYAISDDKAYWSLDGITYIPILAGLGQVYNMIAYTVSGNDFWLASTSFGTYLKQGTNDWTWVSQPNSTNNTSYLKAAGEVLFYTDAQTAFSNNYGSTWQVTKDLHKFDNFLYDASVWYARKGNEIWSSTGNLTEWTRTIADIPAGTVYWAFLGNTMICKAGANIYTYDSNLDQWPLSATLASGAYKLFIHDNKLYAHLPGSSDLIRLDNFGQNPLTYTGVLSADPNVLSFMSAPGKLYAVSQTKLLISPDDGQSFTVKPWPGIVSDAQDGCIYFDNGFIINKDDLALYYSHGEAESWAQAMAGYSSVPNYASNGFLKLNNAVFSTNVINEPFRRYDFDNSIAQYSGSTYQDLNGNTLPDLGEPPLPNTVLRLNLTNTYTNSGLNGTFNISAELQPQTLTPVSPSPYCTFAPANYAVNASNPLLNFGLQCTPNITDLGVGLTNVGPFRPGFDTDIFLTVKNPGTVVADGALSLTLDPDLLFTVVSTTPTATQSGNVLTWPPITGLASLDHLTYVIRVTTPIGTQIGTDVCNLAEIITVGSDNNAADNTNAAATCPRVRNSYDPNDKQVDKAAYKPGTQPPLEYTVRFQNTGTYLASIVVVKDTLSPNLDPSTLQILGASHPLTWSLRGNGIVEFRFDGINLPDMTSDEPGSHGFVQFSVQPRANQPLGLMTENTAFIYFDFNEPIITNTVTSTVVSTHEPINTIRLIAQPNPAHESLRLSWPDGQKPNDLLLYLHDASGRLIRTLRFDQQDLTIDVRTLKAGTYQVWGNDGERQFSAMFEVVR